MPGQLKIPDRLVDWVLTHRVIVLVAIGLVSVAAWVATWGVPVKVSLLQGLMPDESKYQEQVERAKQLGGDSDEMIYVASSEGRELFTPDVLDAIRAAARDLAALPEVDRVFSIVDAPQLVPNGQLSAKEISTRAVVRRYLAEGRVPEPGQGSLSIDVYWPLDPERQKDVDMAALRRTMQTDPIAGRLLSHDADAQGMLLWLAESSEIQNKAHSGIRKKIEEVFSRHGLGRHGFYCAGTLVMQDWIFDEVDRAFFVILPVVVAIVFALVYIIFHRLSYVFLTLGIAGIAILWTFGVISLLFGRITLLVAAVPALILIISTADTIHLASAYVAEFQNGTLRRAAIRKVFSEVGGACLLTSLTTFLGFLSLTVVPAVTVRHMAVACAVGVATALLLALTLVPMALTVLKRPPGARASKSLANRWLDGAVNGCMRISLGYPKTVVAAHLAVLVAAGIVASGLTFDADMVGRFAPGHEIRRSIEFFHSEMFGTTAIEITLEADPGVLLSTDTVVGLSEFERRLKDLPEVCDVISVITIFKVVDQLVGYGSADGLPPSRASAEATVELARRTSPAAIAGLISKDAGLAKVAIRISPTRVMEVHRSAEKIEALGRECLPSNVDVSTSGFHLVVGTAAQEILKSQAKGFLICFACVMAAVTLGIRSIRLSLLAVLPNLFPLALLGGILGLSVDAVDTDVLGIAIVSFGLAVDDTIHFLHRYEIERNISPNARAALEQTFHYTGSAIIRTTVILGIGLTPFALSGYLSIRLLGTYLVFVLGCAVLGDVLLLPALILLTERRKKGQQTEPETLA